MIIIRIVSNEQQKLRHREARMNRVNVIHPSRSKTDKTRSLVPIGTITDNDSAPASGPASSMSNYFQCLSDLDDTHMKANDDPQKFRSSVEATCITFILGG